MRLCDARGGNLEREFQTEKRDRRLPFNKSSPALPDRKLPAPRGLNPSRRPPAWEGQTVAYSRARLPSGHRHPTVRVKLRGVPVTSPGPLASTALMLPCWRVGALLSAASLQRPACAIEVFAFKFSPPPGEAIMPGTRQYPLFGTFLSIGRLVLTHLGSRVCIAAVEKYFENLRSRRAA